MAAASPDRQQRCQADGPGAPGGAAGEREWLLARVNVAPDLTLRAVQAELAGRGAAASYGAVWSFFAAEGYSFKKACARPSRSAPT